MWFGLVYCPWQPEADTNMDEIDVFFTTPCSSSNISYQFVQLPCVFLPFDFRSSCVCVGVQFFFVTFAQSTLVALVIGEECRGHGGDVRHVKEGTGWTEASPRIHLFHPRIHPKGLTILLMEEILHQLRLVVCGPLCIRFQKHPSGGWPWDF